MMICEDCQGIGLVPTAHGSRPCHCQAQVEIRARFNRIGIPPAFAYATLAGFQPSPHTQNALALARRYVREYISGQTKRGLLLTGSTGTGKTHLALAVAGDLAADKGIEARFVDMTRLLKRLHGAAFDTPAPETRDAILRPIFAGELIVVDDLGATRTNDWVFDEIQSLLGQLYNDETPVIITTNLLNQGYDAKALATQPTLGERIGQRMFSRLQEMCMAADMTGPDWRVSRP
jgi:DNA replication protein DnaC